jgi:uncharacterized protein YndB with AHSA1/START domain
MSESEPSLSNLTFFLISFQNVVTPRKAGGIRGVHLKQKNKMKSVVTTMTLDAPSEKVWEVIAKGDGLEKWFSVIESCELEGSGIGAKRTCQTFQGQVLKETILTIDNGAKVFQFSIDEQDMLPTRDIMGTIHITPISASQTNFTWIANYQLLDESMEAAVATGLDQLYQGGIKGIEALLNNR